MGGATRRLLTPPTMLHEGWKFTRSKRRRELETSGGMSAHLSTTGSMRPIPPRASSVALGSELLGLRHRAKMQLTVVWLGVRAFVPVGGLLNETENIAMTSRGRY